MPSHVTTAILSSPSPARRERVGVRDFLSARAAITKASKTLTLPLPQAGEGKEEGAHL